MKKAYFLLFSLALLGCSQQKFVVAPAFTDLSKISLLTEGMPKEEVFGILQVQPFDFYYFEGQIEVYVFYYRLMERRIEVTNRITYVEQGKEMLNENLNSESSQRIGTPFYTEWRRLFVSFESGKMVSAISDSGREDGNTLVILKKGIQQSQDSTNLKVIPYSVLEGNIVAPLSNGNYIVPNGCQGTSTVTPGQFVLLPCQTDVVTFKSENKRGGLNFLPKKKQKKTSNKN